jgi:hypothetical protein
MGGKASMGVQQEVGFTSWDVDIDVSKPVVCNTVA